MKEDDLYDYLLVAVDRRLALVITFVDGDQYHLAHVDLCFSTGFDGHRECEPLEVSFDDCLNQSNRLIQAVRDGILKTSGVGWTSTKPAEPISMSYEVANISEIWDDDKQYYVYEKAT